MHRTAFFFVAFTTLTRLKNVRRFDADEGAPTGGTEAVQRVPPQESRGAREADRENSWGARRSSRGY